MKVLVIGGGGREHALVHTFFRQGEEVHCLPGNGGIDPLIQPASQRCRESDPEFLANYAETHQIDLTVVGPEAFLEKGIVDLFQKRGFPIFGPTQSATQLESSKGYAKEFMEKHHVPTAPFVICSRVDEALGALEKYFPEWEGVVIKPNGLTAGKGVTVCPTLEEAQRVVLSTMQEQQFGMAGVQVVIEKKLQGEEVSLLAFCDGKRMVPMIPSQDHKRLKDGGEGPNTGGMGAYAPYTLT